MQPITLNNDPTALEQPGRLSKSPLCWTLKLMRITALTTRASFFGATARTLAEYLDLVFRRAPVVAVGERKPLEQFVADCDLWGMDFLRYARHVVSEVLSVGRGGSLVVAGDKGRQHVIWFR